MDGWVDGWLAGYNFLTISGYHLWNASFVPGTVLGALSSESIQVLGCRQQMQTLAIISKKELQLSCQIITESMAKADNSEMGRNQGRLAKRDSLRSHLRNGLIRTPSLASPTLDTPCESARNFNRPLSCCPTRHVTLSDPYNPLRQMVSPPFYG